MPPKANTGAGAGTAAGGANGEVVVVPVASYDSEDKADFGDVQGKLTNIAQLAGREDGSQTVTTYDWKALLEPECRPIKGIRGLHYFKMSR